MTWRVCIRSLLNYAAPIVYPNFSKSSVELLQKVQNRALRLCLGCHSASSVDHLHREAKELLVGEHLKLLSAQFLARCLQPHHPSHRVACLPPGPRPMKHTLRSKVLPLVEPYLNADGVIEPGTYQHAIQAIHADVVSSAIQNLAPNRVLGRSPPVIDIRESYLPRITRSTLAQLRSGFCSRLNSYQFKIGRLDNDLCPECGTASHTTTHLFECPAKRTNLTVGTYGKTLGLLPSFSLRSPPLTFYLLLAHLLLLLFLRTMRFSLLSLFLRPPSFSLPLLSLPLYVSLHLCRN